MSETYTQQLTHCPTCSLRIERMDLNTVGLTQEPSQRRGF
jgi:hypothetical protein